MKVDVVSAYHNVTSDSCRLEVVKEITDDEGTSTFALHIIPCDAGTSVGMEIGIEDPDLIVDYLLYLPHVCETDSGTCASEKVERCKTRVAPDPAQSATVLDRMQAKGIDPKYWPDIMITPRQTILQHTGITNNSIAEFKAAQALEGELSRSIDQEPTPQVPKPKRVHVELRNGQKEVRYV